MRGLAMVVVVGFGTAKLYSWQMIQDDSSPTIPREPPRNTLWLFAPKCQDLL